MTELALRSSGPHPDGPARPSSGARPMVRATTPPGGWRRFLWGRPTVGTALTTLGLTTLSSVLYVLCLPPWGYSWLGWIAPVGWLVLLTMPRRLDWLDYTIVYLTGAVMWSTVFAWFAMPHPAGVPGVAVIGMYFGWYVVAMTLIGRELTHKWRWPLIAVGPVVWVSIELVRGNLFTGLTMASLAHSQVDYLSVIQVADLAGAYGVGAVMVAGCAGAVAAFRGPGLLGRIVQPVIAAALVAAVLGYGQWRLSQDSADTSRPPLKALVIQGSIDTIFGPEATTPREQFLHYVGITREARQVDPEARLILWPEGMLPAPLFTDPSGAQDVSPDERAAHLLATGYDPARPESPSNHRAVTLVTGVNTLVFPEVPLPRPQTHADVTAMPKPIGVYNSAIQIDPAGEVVDVYHKRHLVMFGEYLPLAELAPVFYYLTPMQMPLSTGDRFVAMVVDGYRLAPSICFESTVPHLITEQIRELSADGGKPDVLVNLANDGSFFGTAALDLHLACNIFRSVENRTPTLVAANTGFSAEIDGNGRVRQRGPRRETGFLSVAVRPDPRWSVYTWLGDLPAWGALTISLVAITGVLVRKTSRLGRAR